MWTRSKERLQRLSRVLQLVLFASIARRRVTGRGITVSIWLTRPRMKM
jgi:hypothetical protein